MESVARGGTRWKRFAVVMVPSVAATAAVGVALAQGALAASFSVSGQQAKVSVDRLDGKGFVQYGTIDVQHGGKEIPVAVSAFKSAELRGLCQSVVIPVPVFGDVSVKLNAGNDGKVVEAKNLYIDLDQLDADATFTNINIGVSANDTDNETGPGLKPGDTVLPGSFAQEADEALLTDVKQTSWATSAGTFKLSGLSLNVAKGKNECF
ncbi:cholesterol esterase [Streptomyces verrucosisporus]|uniref:DUF6230 family protein n=1 Tax=Streptomyces verrucosisporus TaxID=1695161 RepID=UPI0019D0AF37|nr:DUF6230 family protein [Streptomyces verrucosisporus]MBN3931503.1 cholesterol esterase [Streptomyces verrucosisporus]